MDAGFDFKGQRFCIADMGFLSHGRDPARCRASMRDGNLQNRGIGCVWGGFGVFRRGAAAGRRILVELGIPLGGHLMNECDRKPNQEDGCRSTDKLPEFHRLFRKCLPFLLAGFVTDRRKKQPQRSDRCRLLKRRLSRLPAIARLPPVTVPPRRSGPKSPHTTFSHGHFQQTPPAQPRPP